MSNKQKQKRPFITVKEAIVSLAVILFTALAFEKFDLEPPPPTRSVLQQEAEIFALQIPTITASQIAKIVTPADGKPTLVVFYASWCRYCKKLFPQIISLQKNGKNNDMHFLFLSVDKNRNDLANYILKHDYNQIFTPYIIEENEHEKIAELFSQKGRVYNSGIPYTVIFDGKGNIISAAHGAISKDELLDLINGDKSNLK